MGQISIELALAIFIPFLGILGGVVGFFTRKWMQKVEVIMKANEEKNIVQDTRLTNIESMFAVINEKMSNILEKVDYKYQLAKINSDLAVIKEGKQ